MIGKSIKYLVVILVNSLLLTTLLALWTDKVELTFNEFVRPIEFLKILGISFGLLILLRIAVGYFRTHNINSIRRRLVISVWVTLAVSSFLYINYGKKVFEHRIKHKTIRQSIATKIQPVVGLAYGGKADSLTIQEYRIISNINWFPELPSYAKNISYTYDYDGFLPDYDFDLSYSIPAEKKVDTFTYKDDTFSKGRYFKIIDNQKRVTYYEFLW
ncbi:MAG: hypothetical protein AAFX55_13275 [Bacteroidota bacterium]